MLQCMLFVKYEIVLKVDLRHVDEMKGSNVVDIGIDLTEFYTSVEWDILEVPAVRYFLHILLKILQRYNNFLIIHICTVRNCSCHNIKTFYMMK